MYTGHNPIFILRRSHDSAAAFRAAGRLSFFLVVMKGGTSRVWGRDCLLISPAYEVPIEIYETHLLFTAYLSLPASD